MVLVTGATGLLGSYLVKLLLAKGEQVRAIRRQSSDLSLLTGYADKVEWVYADVQDVPSLEDAMQGITQVYHCAAVISFVPSEVDGMMKANIEGTANVMNAALNEGVQKVVYVSSIAAFGIAAEDKVIDEKFTDPNINKAFWYYRSKHYAEREAWRANAEGLDVVVACPGTILGAGWWDDEPNSLFKEIYHGLKFYTTASMGFVDVRDVVNCLYLLMQDKDNSGEKYIIVAENTKFNDLMFLMADTMKVKRPSIHATPFIRSVAWVVEAFKAWFTKKRPLITKESAALASINFRFSNQKIKQRYNYNFRPISQTVVDTARVFLQTKGESKEWGVFEELH